MQIAPRIVAEGLGVERNHDGRFMFVTEDVDHSSLKDKMTSFDGWKLQPARDQDTQDMAMGEEDHIIPDRLGPGNDPVTALGYLLGGVTVRSRMGEYGPVRILLPDLLGGDPLVVAIMPLGQVLCDFRMLEQAGELAGPSCTLVRAAKDQLKVPVGELRLERGGLALSFQGQGNFAEGSVSTVFAPLGFTVADKNDLGA